MDVLKSIIVWIIGICFMVVLFPLTFIIWLVVLPFDKKRIIVHWLLVNQSFILTRIMPVWGIKTKGREKAISGTTYVVISNHQSILDILFINSLRYNYKWISKIENVKLPFLGWYLKMADYITVDRDNEESKAEMLEKSLAYLKNGTSIMLFPEGTRSSDSEIGFFKRGAFQLAIQAGVPILPIVIDGTGGILPKHGLLFRSGNHVKVRVYDPVMPESFETINPDELAHRFSNMMKEWLTEIREESEIR